MSPTPYIGFGNDTLAKLPIVEDGDEILCPECKGKHKLEAGKDDKGEKNNTILFYTCGKNLKLGAVNQRLVVGIKVDASGEI